MAVPVISMGTLASGMGVYMPGRAIMAMQISRMAKTAATTIMEGF